MILEPKWLRTSVVVRLRPSSLVVVLKRSDKVLSHGGALQERAGDHRENMWCLLKSNDGAVTTTKDQDTNRHGSAVHGLQVYHAKATVEAAMQCTRKLKS